MTRKKRKSATFYIADFPFLIGAGEMNRTPDLLITNELLYRLSYTGLYISGISMNSFFERIAALRGARNPHVLKYIPVSCAPCALHFISKI